MMERTTIGPFFVRSDQYAILRNRKVKTAGIYRIINAHNGKSYVGSTRDLSSRLDCHASCLTRGVHSNQYLQLSFNKHGPGMFVFYIDSTCDPDELLQEENAAIRHYASMDRSAGYNLQMGIRDDSSGRWCEEVRNRISESNKRTYAQRPESRRKNSDRLTEWHRNNPGISGGPRNVLRLENKALGLTFTGSANELIRAYPEQRLYQSAIWRLSKGQAIVHKGWSVIQ